MSSTEIAVSPTKKSTKKQKSEQIVSSGVTNGSNLLDNIECNSANINDDESVNEQTVINNPNETNKDCHVDACMEPLLIQNCVDEFATNPINDANCLYNNDISCSPIQTDDLLDLMNLNDDDEVVTAAAEENPTDEGGGDGVGFIKTNLSLNLNEILCDDKNLPKNKKFLESSDDQMVGLFFSTITVTPTTDDDILVSSFLCNDNTPITPTDVDAEMVVGPVDFFNRKIDEDDTFDTTFTDTADNYQENETNLCSLNDNFNENYCSFSSIDYKVDKEPQNESSVGNEFLQPDTFLGDCAGQMRQQRPSIVIDCYDSDSDKNSKSDDVVVDVVLGEAKINDYCFYFDQTIEEDDDDACYVNGLSDHLEGHVHTKEEDNVFEESETENLIANKNGKTLDEENPDDIDECFETEEEIFNDEDLANEGDDDKSLASQDEDDDEGVINESCMSVNVSRCFLSINF